MYPASNLFLVGSMGAGKTTVGRGIAELLGMRFVDLDVELERVTGVSVTIIFDIEGEAGFRQREARMLAEYAAQDGLVLATGGGSVLLEENQRVLRDKGFVVYLETTVDQQLARLDRDRKRPLLRTPDRRARLEQLALARNPIYQRIADLVVPSGTRAPRQAIQQLLALLPAEWRTTNGVASCAGSS